MRALSRAAVLARDWTLLAASRPFAAPPRPLPQGPRVLVLGYGAIGDLLFLLPALKALRDARPGSRLTFLSNRHPGSEELLPASGLADESWFYELSELSGLGARARLAERVSAAGFDAVLVSNATPMGLFSRALLPVPLRAGHLRRLETAREGWSAPRRAAWKLKRAAAIGEFERRLSINRPVWVSGDKEHTAALNLKLAAALGVAVPEASRARPELPEGEAEARFAEKALAGGAGLAAIGLHLGSPATQYAKLWPAPRWAEAAQALSERHACRFVLLGGADEREAATVFRAGFRGEVVDLVGRTRLLEAFAVIRRCALFMSSDTGLSKAAMALGTPTVSVWGPTSRNDNGVLWEPEKHAEVVHPVPCQPCVSLGLRAEGPGVINFSNCGHRDCLAKLETKAVVEAVRRLHGASLPSRAK